MVLPSRLLTRLVLLMREPFFLCGLATTPRLPDRIHTRPRFYDNAISCARHASTRIAHTRLLRVCVRAQREERFNNFASTSLQRYVSLPRRYVQHCRETADNPPRKLQDTSKIMIDIFSVLLRQSGILRFF